MANTNRSRMHNTGKKSGPKQNATLRTDDLSKVIRGGNPVAWNKRNRDNTQKEKVG